MVETYYMKGELVKVYGDWDEFKMGSVEMEGG